MDLPCVVAFLFEQDGAFIVALEDGLVLQLLPAADANYLLRLCRRQPQHPTFTDVVQVRHTIATIFAKARRPQISEQSKQQRGEWCWIPLSIRFPNFSDNLLLQPIPRPIPRDAAQRSYS